MKPIDLIDWGASTLAGYELSPDNFVTVSDNRRNNGGKYEVERSGPDGLMHTVFLHESLRVCMDHMKRIVETA